MPRSTPHTFLLFDDLERIGDELRAETAAIREANLREANVGEANIRDNARFHAARYREAARLHNAEEQGSEADGGWSVVTKDVNGEVFEEECMPSVKQRTALKRTNSVRHKLERKAAHVRYAANAANSNKTATGKAEGDHVAEAVAEATVDPAQRKASAKTADKDDKEWVML